MYYLVVCIIFFGAFFLVMQFTKSKSNKEFRAKVSKLAPGVRITAADGMTGIVTEVLNDTVKVDFSPDESGSVIEITKEAVAKVLD